MSAVKSLMLDEYEQHMSQSDPFTRIESAADAAYMEALDEDLVMFDESFFSLPEDPTYMDMEDHNLIVIAIAHDDFSVQS